MTTSAPALGSTTFRILVVDDHPTFCEGLSHRIDAQSDMSVCGTAADVGEALEKISETRPHLAVVDISLKNSDGLDLVKTLVSHHSQVRTLVHSMFDETIYADRCLRAGAQGYLNKEADPNEVILAIREIMAGAIYLTPNMTNRVLSQAFRGSEPGEDTVTALTDRQLEIFRLIGEGQDVRGIAKRLHISAHTVETHRENIKRKLGIERLPDLNRRAVLWVQDNR